MSDCIFCSIVNDNLKKNYLYENDDVIVVNDINPQAPVHFLVISKKHIRSINDLSNNDASVINNMILIGKKIAKNKKIEKSGYKMLFNVEKGGGQVIFHLHLHILGGWSKSF